MMYQRKITLLLSLVFFVQALFAQKQSLKIITSTDLQEDVNVLEKVLKYYHPGLYRYQSEAAIDGLLDDLRVQFSTDQDEAAILLAFAKFSNQLQCGHTYPNPWNMEKEIRERLMDRQHYFPFGFQIVDRQMIITKNVSDIKAIDRGTIISTINGIGVGTIIDSLIQVTKADGLNTQAHRVKALELTSFGMRNHSVFDLYFPLFFPFGNAQFEITYLENGKEITIITPALTRADRLNRMEAKYGKAPMKEENWSFQITDEGLAIIQLGDFAIWNWDFDYKKWFADVFQTIKSQKVQAVAVDIRGNGGGLSEVPDELLTYLVDKPLPLKNTYDQLIRNYQADSTLWPYLDGYDTSLKNGLPKEYVIPLDNGMYQLRTDGNTNTIQPKANTFSGQVFFLADASNSSATFSLLSMVQSNNIATIVGEAGGGNKQGINGGSYFFLRLPNSKMEIDIPLIFYQPKTAMPDEAIQADILVKMTVEDISNGKDAAMEKIKELLKKK